jgi:hypothetical protein
MTEQNHEIATPEPEGRSAFLQSAAVIERRSWWRRARALIRRERPQPAAQFSAQAELDPRQFVPTEEGSGCFGKWTLDEAGLPAYEYRIDQYKDLRAVYPNSENLDRRDHWHQIGNFRITALASNDGTVQVYLADRGGVFLNRFEAWEYDRRGSVFTRLLYRLLRWLIGQATRLIGRKPQFAPFTAETQSTAPSQPARLLPPRGVTAPDVINELAQAHGGDFSAQATQDSKRKRAQRDPEATRYAFAGGYGYLHDGAECWATAFRYAPDGAEIRRVFGTGYFQTETVYRDIRVVRRVYPPYGDDPTLLTDVTIENLGTHEVELAHYEYWDVNTQQLQLEWLRTGNFAPLSDDARRGANRHFTPAVEWLAETATLRFQQQLTLEDPPPEALDPDKPGMIDWAPAHIFLADLSGQPNAFYVHKRRFFGSGGALQPDAVCQQRPGDAAGGDTSGEVMPFCLVLRRELRLAPGEQQTLRYAYGTARPEGSLAFLDAYRPPADVPGQTRASWQDALLYFTTGEDPVLQREMTWHAYNLLSAVVYNAFHKTRTVPQGSAYLYLHGADGAPRDLALFTLPMVYLNPAIARDMLRLIMRLTDAQTGQIWYAFAGHGMVTDGLNIHKTPSDLDLFFLLAMSEYLAATGDLAFLREEVPFYPPDAPPPGDGITVLDHIRVAVRHLFEGVSFGQNGLIKVGSGDWSDSIVLETAIRDGVGPFGVTYNNSKQHGESILNSQMALYILPLLAAIIRPYDPQLADTIHDAPSQPDRLERLRAAVAQQWNPGGWYNRAILRNHANHEVVIAHLDLEAQPWALISGLARETGTEATLIETIDRQLDGPSPIGGTLIEGGMVWPAISQLLTWGYARCGRADLAWRSLHRNTFAMHSYAYPDIWLNTWSGPDGINGLSSDLPGGTWASPITPMTDFPIMNANQDALALLALLRVCGIEMAADGSGITIRPQVLRERFVLDTPLLRVAVEPGRIAGEYRPIVNGSRTLSVHVPSGTTKITASVNGQPLDNPVPSGDHLVALPLTFQAGEAVAFEVCWDTKDP